ncbi:MAG TPA: ATPase [Syntrophus sp. (in: bacteria)]|jgi:predicted Fe-Mo cluster-binding NifX family protein|nr:ATPase [Syntrophus sp. (in: bacteria)]
MQLLRIAVPTVDGYLCPHFGHCSAFVLMDVDKENKTILKKESHEAPPHEPGLLPQWLAEKGADLIIAGGMGARAQDLFNQKGIGVLIGAPSETPEKIVNDYMSGALLCGQNLCDH